MTRIRSFKAYSSSFDTLTGTSQLDKKNQQGNDAIPKMTLDSLSELGLIVNDKVK